MEPYWWLTKDGDVACLALYERHYSAHRYRDGRIRKLFCGPGEKVPLRAFNGEAFFVWRKFKDGCIDERTGKPQEGINCAAFRNEGTAHSSDLVRQADAIADCCWPDRRHYTYVDGGEGPVKESWLLFSRRRMGAVRHDEIRAAHLGASAAVTDVPCGTSREATRRRRRGTRECSGNCGRERDRPGQSFCRACHALYMVGWRKRKNDERERLEAEVERLRRAS